MMKCLTALILRDPALVPEPSFVIVNGEAEQQQVIHYLNRIEEMKR